jgi:hypothetical protein
LSVRQEGDRGDSINCRQAIVWWCATESPDEIIGGATGVFSAAADGCWWFCAMIAAMAGGLSVESPPTGLSAGDRGDLVVGCCGKAVESCGSGGWRAEEGSGRGKIDKNFCWLKLFFPNFNSFAQWFGESVSLLES